MIGIYFVTKDRNIVQILDNDKNIYPKDFLSSRSESANIGILNYTKNASFECIKELGNIDLSVNGIILLCDNGIYESINSKYGLYFIIVNIGHYANNEGITLKQYLEQKIMISFRVFFYIKSLLQDHLPLLRLPLRNFKKEELHNVYVSIKRYSDIADWDEIQNQIRNVKDITKKPLHRGKRKKKEINYVDDKDHWFAFGTEVHSRQETTELKRHNFLCEVSSKYRFGHLLDYERHFNVKYTDRENIMIEGVFSNCHDEQQSISARTHINMFSSDYMS
ncbi:hypothetical protein CWC46_21125 [Prodigiosinella confusarubida]|uniref:Uncharacterized protein n=1 Tax=Serratia sp. (strain ATCC 39006) TaxID=104623 RepID=A0A2I5TPA6_SERS3|nr:hypothetical protein [Serratia sp. ATCC 39006]AUH02073.1 hypothetical protein CWC46_21125 [Serratia sp. ATCC 39006]AUH06394.1 hypothetical protein Ser39006_021120 [Serratia sp. ATCC 39006]